MWQQEEDVSSEPFAVTADEQSEGIGRSGRSWLSPRGGIWLTVGWPIAQNPSHYAAAPLAVGAALALLLERLYDLSSSIKWPNDIFIASCKLAGILCQTVTDNGRQCLLVGIGLNANLDEGELHGAFRVPATSLQRELGRTVDLEGLRQQLLETIAGCLARFENEQLEPYLKDLRARMHWLGEGVSCETSEGAPPINGIIEGIDDEGRLLLRVGAESRSFVCGELHRIGRVPAGVHEINIPDHR